MRSLDASDSDADPTEENLIELECGPKSNVMVALPNIGSALCSTPQFG